MCLQKLSITLLYLLTCSCISYSYLLMSFQSNTTPDTSLAIMSGVRTIHWKTRKQGKNFRELYNRFPKVEFLYASHDKSTSYVKIVLCGLRFIFPLGGKILLALAPLHTRIISASRQEYHHVTKKLSWSLCGINNTITDACMSKGCRYYEHPNSITHSVFSWIFVWTSLLRTFQVHCLDEGAVRTTHLIWKKFVLPSSSSPPLPPSLVPHVLKPPLMCRWKVWRRDRGGN